MHVPDPPNSARSLFSNVTMFVYAKDDVVSDNLRGPMRNWENLVSAGQAAGPGERLPASICVPCTHVQGTRIAC